MVIGQVLDEPGDRPPPVVCQPGTGDAQRQREPRAEPHQVLERASVRVDAAGRDHPGHQVRAVGRAQRREVDELGTVDGQPGETLPAGHHDDAARGRRHHGTRLCRLVHTVEQHQKPLVRRAAAEQRDPFGGGGRDVRIVDPESTQEHGDEVADSYAALVPMVVQIGVQGTTVESVLVDVRPMCGGRTLANTGHTGQHEQSWTAFMFCQCLVQGAQHVDAIHEGMRRRGQLHRAIFPVTRGNSQILN
nr:hypothetical protein [Lentzea atacamensis]